MTTIWIHSRSRLISDALGTLLERVDGFRVHTGSAPPQEADVAIWDLRGFKAPFPLPPEMPTLALIDSSQADKMMILSIGYKGYLNGEEAVADLKRAIEVVLNGEIWAERSLMSSMVMRARAPALTAREHQAFSLLVMGLSNKQIAQRLGISEKTVKVYVSGLLEKLGAKNRMDLVMHFNNRKTLEEE